MLTTPTVAIDLTILAEAIPQQWSFILSSLACIWGLGNAITGLIGNSSTIFGQCCVVYTYFSGIAWPILVNFGCPSGSTPANCSKGDNMGWRYLYIILGGLCLVMSLIRAFVLRSAESPRWLISCGRMQEAAEVINNISKTNKSDYHIMEDQFMPIDRHEANTEVRSLRANIHRAAKLFSGPKQLRLMVGLLMIWALIGIA